MVQALTGFAFTWTTQAPATVYRSRLCVPVRLRFVAQRNDASNVRPFDGTRCRFCVSRHFDLASMMFLPFYVMLLGRVSTQKEALEQKFSAAV